MWSPKEIKEIIMDEVAEVYTNDHLYVLLEEYTITFYWEDDNDEEQESEDEGNITISGEYGRSNADNPGLDFYHRFKCEFPSDVSRDFIRGVVYSFIVKGLEEEK